MLVSPTVAGSAGGSPPTVVVHRVAERPLPTGLERLRSLLGAPPEEPSLNVLSWTDHQAMQELQQRGLLSQVPGIHVDAHGKGAETDIAPALQAHTTLMLSAHPVQALMAEQPLPANVDQRLVRWLIVFHEAAHTQRGQMDAPVMVKGWSVEAQTALNGLLWEGGGLMGAAQDQFDENFADAYGALMLLKVTQDAPEARRAVAYLHQVRLAERETLAKRSQTQGVRFHDGHSEGDVLGPVLQDPWVNASPQVLLDRARQLAGQALVTAWRDQPELSLLSWARQAPQSSSVPTQASFRVNDYLRLRMVAYVLAKPTDPALMTGALRAAGGSPLLLAVAQEDQALRRSFLRMVPESSRRDLETFLKAHVPPAGALTAGGVCPLDADPHFQTWADQATDHLLRQHQEILVKDQIRNQQLAQQVEQALGRHPQPSKQAALTKSLRRRANF